MDFKEARVKISIIELAEKIGYVKLSKGQAINLTYTLGNIRNPEDEIVIFPQKNTYFSRKGKFDDKGNLINFILNRLDKFSATKTGFAGVSEVLDKHLNNSLSVNRTTSVIEKTQKEEIKFNLTYWNPRKLSSENINYLLQRRKLSEKTIDDFRSRLFLYTVGNNHVGFPFRKPGEMEIVNFEMRDYFPENNVSYKAFATGGDKSNSCWIGNFVPFDKVTDIYLFESAIDAMSFYEINHFTKDTTCAFISTGGYATKSQIESIKSVFPINKIKWHCCFDKDGTGNGFDVATAYYLSGEDCKAFKRFSESENESMVYINFPSGELYSYKESEFSSLEFLQSKGKDGVVDIIKPPRYKDWNELLIYYKRFSENLGPGMKFISSIEEVISQLDLRGYHQLTDTINTSQKELIDNLLQYSNFSISAPLAESNAYTLMVDCNLLTSLSSTIVPIPSNIYVIDKLTQQPIPAFSIKEFLEKEHINIFKDLHSNDFKKMLDTHTLTISKKGAEKSFERVTSPSGWSLKECAALKKKSFDTSLEL